MLIREGLPEEVIVVTSRTFLQLAEGAGHLADAEAAWAVVSASDPRVNLAVNYQVIPATPR